MAIRLDDIQLASSGNHLYPLIKATDATRLRIQSSNGYVDIGSGTSSSWGYILTDRANFYVDKGVHFDGNIQGYGGNETAKFALYYDSANTNYYLDPSSESQLSGGLAIGTTSWDTTNLTLDVAGNASLRNGFYMGVSSNNYNSWQGRIYNSGSGQYWSGQSWYFNGSGWGGGNYWTLDNSGNSVAAGSHRAPIFYDSADTTYYLDPANTGTAINVAGEYTASVDHGNAGFIQTWINTNTGTSAYVEASFGQSNSSELRIGHAPNYSSADWNASWVYAVGKPLFLKSNTGNVVIYTNGSGSSNVAATFDTGQNAIFTTSSRAPIFYDSNDTNYYVNPAGDSQMNQIHLANYVRHLGDLDTYFGFNGADSWKLHVGGGDRLIANTSTLTSNLKVKIPVAWDNGTLENNAIYAKNSNDGFGFGNGTGISTWFAWSTENGLRRMIDCANSGEYINLRTANTNRVQINSSGLSMQNSGAIDLGSGASSIKKTAGGTNGNHAAIELYSSGTADSGSAIAIQQQTSEGDTILFADYEPHVEWGISTENSNNEIQFTAGGSTGTMGSKTLYNNAGSARTAYKKMIFNLGTGVMSVGGDVRAPIFYDYNDTGKYINPAGNSNITSLDLSGDLDMNNANINNVNHIKINDPGGGEGIEWLSGNGWKIFESPNDLSNASGNLQFTTGSTRLGTLTTAGTLELSGGGVGSGSDSVAKVLYPKGATYTESTNNITGAIKITLPQSWTNTMMTIHVSIFDYSSNESFDLILSGYNYAGSGGYWTNCTSQAIAHPQQNKSFNIRYGHDGTKCCIFIGETTSTWSYPKVVVTKFMGGHSNQEFPKWDDGWDITREASLASNIDITQVAYQQNRYIQELYDIDDTSYLLNPAGTNTYLNAVKINYLGLGTAPNTSGGYRINMGGSIDMNNYSLDYINQLHFNANVRFYDSSDDSYLNYKYGDTNNGGIRFRNGSDTIKGYIYADNGGFGLLDNDGAWAVRSQTGTDPLQLRCDNNVEFEVHTSYTFSPGSSRAPIFYDSDDTNYYVSPAGTSRMQNINMTSAGASGLLITHTDIRSARDSNWTGNPSTQGKIQYHSARWYIVSDSNSNRVVQFRKDNTDVSHIDNAGRYIGDVQASTDVRAPIFYDTDDTNYYTSPASTSLLNNLNANRFGINNSSSTTKYGISLYGGYSTGEPTYGLLFTGTAGLGTYGSVTSDWATYFTMNNNDARGWIFRKVGVGNTSSISAGGVATFGSSTRSPIFYDSDNTSYNLTPDSVATGQWQVNTPSGYVRIGPGNGSYSHFYTDRGKFYFNKALTVDTGVIQSYNEDLLLRRLESNTDYIRIKDTNIGFFLDTSEDMRLENDGDLHVEGDVIAYSTTVSDKALKDDVITIDSALDKVSKLRGVEYTWNNTSRKGQKDIGVIAQEVEEVIPEIVREKKMSLVDGEKYKTVDYEKLTAVLIEAVKELKEEVEELKNKCNDCTK